MTSPSPKPLCVRAHARASTFCKQDRFKKDFKKRNSTLVESSPYRICSPVSASSRATRSSHLDSGQILLVLNLVSGQTFQSFWSWSWLGVRLFNPFVLDLGQWSNFSILDLILVSGQTFQSLWSGVKFGPPRIVTISSIIKGTGTICQCLPGRPVKHKWGQLDGGYEHVRQVARDNSLLWCYRPACACVQLLRGRWHFESLLSGCLQTDQAPTHHPENIWTLKKSKEERNPLHRLNLSCARLERNNLFLGRAGPENRAGLSDTEFAFFPPTRFLFCVLVL